MIELGKFNRLTVFRKAVVGYFIGNTPEDEVLLPLDELEGELVIGDDIEVFVYVDSDKNHVATLKNPTIQRDEFALLKAKDVTSIGAFMDWGIEKDLFIPFREQALKIEEGNTYVVYLYLDEKSGRLTGSSKLNRYFKEADQSYTRNDEVDLLIIDQTDLGYTAIVDNKYRGLLYKNEVFQPLQMGFRTRGYVKKLREDGKLDLSLEIQGSQNMEPTAQKILDRLVSHGGFLPLHDKSNPEQIKKMLHLSKKAFKRAIGNLYKAKRITISKDGITIVE